MESETRPTEYTETQEEQTQGIFEGKVRILGGNHLIADIQELMAEDYPIPDGTQISHII